MANKYMDYKDWCEHLRGFDLSPDINEADYDKEVAQCLAVDNGIKKERKKIGAKTTDNSGKGIAALVRALAVLPTETYTS